MTSQVPTGWKPEYPFENPFNKPSLWQEIAARALHRDIPVRHELLDIAFKTLTEKIETERKKLIAEKEATRLDDNELPVPYLYRLEGKIAALDSVLNLLK